MAIAFSGQMESSPPPPPSRGQAPPGVQGMEKELDSRLRGGDEVGVRE